MAAVIAMFSGCSKPKTHDNPFAIYNDYEGIQVAIGDKKNNITKLLGPDERYITEFEEENIERIEYWDTEDVDVDYDMATGIVIGARIENSQWSIFNGLKAGDSAEAVTKNYPSDMIHRYDNSNTMYIAYNKDGKIIEYSEDAPYIVRFAVEGGKITVITIQENERYLF